MLNELLIIERGARQAGIEMVQLHPDIKEAQRVPTLLVRLTGEGHVASVLPVPRSTRPWTLRNGKHNSFPFVQPKQALWTVAEDDERRKMALGRNHTEQYEALIALASDFGSSAVLQKKWPSDGLLKQLRERQQYLTSLENTDAAVVLQSVERFLLACEVTRGGDPQHLLQEIIGKLVEDLQRTATRDWIDVAIALLIKGSGAFLFDAASDGSTVLSRNVIAPLSAALYKQEIGSSGTRDGRCALTGRIRPLISSTFPEPNLPRLGETLLFARNKDTPASWRYGRYGADTMPVGEEVADRLAAAAKALTSPDRLGKTWSSIPGEVPKHTDLLLAFVQGAPDAELAGSLIDDDFSEEEPGTGSEASSIAAFEKRTERLINALQATIGADFRKTPVQLAVLRKVDPANRKVVYSDVLTVHDLFDAAREWQEGERHVPPWLMFPVLRKGEKRVRPMSPPHVAPLGIIAFSKGIYIRRGLARQETAGLSAPEALDLFLAHHIDQDKAAQQRVERVLRLVLMRRTTLTSGTAHALRCSLESAKAYDRLEALRTVTILGVLLYKLNPTREGYMNDPAFRLGQLLAAADVVHAGYCADLRDGHVPPSLLGNQVFTMAQTAPEKALAVLCRRWKPYDGWAKRVTRARERASRFINSKQKAEQQRGWDIRQALRHAREMRPLADELALSLVGHLADDVFRARLLLGYIAGLPKAGTEDDSSDDAARTIAEEN